GRTLKGPVNQVLSVGGFGEFQRHFGGLWQPSTVAYAVEQFFENGGRQALIVRIANGARPPTVTLPAGGAQLRLVALNPGSREYLRAGVQRHEPQLRSSGGKGDGRRAGAVGEESGR